MSICDHMMPSTFYLLLFFFVTHTYEHCSSTSLIIKHWKTIKFIPYEKSSFDLILFKSTLRIDYLGKHMDTEVIINSDYDQQQKIKVKK